MSTNRGMRLFAPVAGWFTAVLLHAFHNFSVSFSNIILLCAGVLVDWGGVWITVVIIFWALYQEGRWMRTYLADEVSAGLLTPGQYEAACTALGRMRYRLGAFESRGWGAYLLAGRFLHRLSKLAYRKHHQVLFEDEQSGRAIEQLRKEIMAVQKQLA
jgi:hypothetical protein